MFIQYLLQHSKINIYLFIPSRSPLRTILPNIITSDCASSERPSTTTNSLHLSSDLQLPGSAPLSSTLSPGVSVVSLWSSALSSWPQWAHHLDSFPVIFSRSQPIHRRSSSCFYPFRRSRTSCSVLAAVVPFFILTSYSTSCLLPHCSTSSRPCYSLTIFNSADKIKQIDTVPCTQELKYMQYDINISHDKCIRLTHCRRLILFNGIGKGEELGLQGLETHLSRGRSPPTKKRNDEDITIHAEYCDPNLQCYKSTIQIKV